MANVFDLTHDSGGALASHYDFVITGGNASITAVSAMDGSSNGVSLIIDDTNSVLLEKNFTPPSSDELRLRFYFDPNSITIPSGSTSDFLLSVSLVSSGLDTISATVYWDSDLYKLKASHVWGSDGEPSAINYFTDVTLTDEPHCIDIRIVRESSDGANDGVFQLFLDGVSQNNATGESNYNGFAALTRVQISTSGTANAAGVSGTMYYDELEMDDDASVSLCGSPPAANAFRFLGMAADTGKLYVAGPKDGVLSLYEYDLAALTEGGTVDTFGGATDAEIDAGSRGVRPVVGPMSDGVLYLYGRDGNDVQVQRDDNGGGWTDLGPGTGTWAATKVVRALMPDTLAGADLVAAFDDDDIYRSYDEGVSWVKMGDATPTGLATAARHPTAGNELILAGDSAGVIYQSHNFGVSDQDISPSGGGVPSSRTVDLRVAAGGNDGYAIQTLGVYISTSLTILFGNTASRQYEACLRFINVPIPAGATITAAYVELVAATTGSGTLSMNISAEDADNPAAVTGYSDFYARLRTTANSTWAVPDFVVGQVYQTVDISGAVQEVVNRAGWADGQAMQIFIDTVSGSVNRQAVAYDDVPASAALLHVAYSVTQPMGIAQAIAFSL